MVKKYYNFNLGLIYLLVIINKQHYYIIITKIFTVFLFALLIKTGISLQESPTFSNKWATYFEILSPWWLTSRRI